jgi:hypothetical protein
MVYIKPDDTLKQLATQLFGYRGNKFQVNSATHYQMSNYWNGGSKATCYAINRAGLKVVSPSTKTNDPNNKQAHVSLEIPPGIFLIEHRISSGKDLGITVISRPDELDTGALPETHDCNDHELIYLCFTLAYKSNYRFNEAQRSTNINAEDWNNAKQSCISKGLTDKRGTPNLTGKNIANSTQKFP